VTTRVAVADGIVEVLASTVSDGDFHLDQDPALLHARRQRFLPGSWSQPDEVHGTDVAVVVGPGGGDRRVADAVVTRLHEEILAVWVGDCAPVALVGGDGAIGAVHVGWRGALDGVLDTAFAALGSSSVTAVLGPCIRGCCYEFGADELARFTERFGPEVEGRTRRGTPSLDMPQVVAAAVAARGATLVDLGGCTGCSDGTWFSHRRGERGRQVLTVVKRHRTASVAE
jgi:copper oxidase (laccase) domain-containing protein